MRDPVWFGCLVLSLTAGPNCGPTSDTSAAGASGAEQTDARADATSAGGYGTGGSSGYGTGGGGANPTGGTGGVSGVGGTSPGGSAGSSGSGGFECTGTCEGLCQNALAAGCPPPFPANMSQALCESGCAAFAAQIPVECACPWESYLACAEVSTVQCPTSQCSSILCLEEGLEFPACATERIAFEDCALPCMHDSEQGGGGVAGGSSVERSYVYKNVGCTCPSPPPPGSPPGDPCSTARDCEAFCCDCPTDQGKYTAHVCVDGICADRDDACGDYRPGLCYAP